mmetsp:Transcript_12070/g.44800  ORF Transcript_12070/g.44800 Transcript_12070/m.44800 type:complete len:206 (-) Transcript_12070:1399-2016(-)|eukprot:scaffold1702_cov253-Pinguiococcus_pyrenoidosus.AAC.4
MPLRDYHLVHPRPPLLILGSGHGPKELPHLAFVLLLHAPASREGLERPAEPFGLPTLEIGLFVTRIDLGHVARAGKCIDVFEADGRGCDSVAPHLSSSPRSCVRRALHSELVQALLTDGVKDLLRDDRRDGVNLLVRTRLSRRLGGHDALLLSLRHLLEEEEIDVGLEIVRHARLRLFLLRFVGTLTRLLDRVQGATSPLQEDGQ